jgi:hypothetical protein
MHVCLVDEGMRFSNLVEVDDRERERESIMISDVWEQK